MYVFINTLYLHQSAIIIYNFPQCLVMLQANVKRPDF